MQNEEIFNKRYIYSIFMIHSTTVCLGKVSLEPELSTLTSTAMFVTSLVIEALPESVLEKRSVQYI